MCRRDPYALGNVVLSSAIQQGMGYPLPLKDEYGEVNSYDPNVDKKPSVWAVMENISCEDVPRVGTYSWNFQELLKGLGGAGDYIDFFDTDSQYTGWSFNLSEDGAYYTYDSYTDTGDPSGPKVPKSSEELNKTDPLKLRTQPLFAKNPENSFLFTNNPVTAGSVTDSEGKTIELLANEFPALTYAAGHREVKSFNSKYNVDIRESYIDGEKWPEIRTLKEWRHNDIYFVAYPYLYQMYDNWNHRIKELIRDENQ